MISLNIHFIKFHEKVYKKWASLKQHPCFFSFTVFAVLIFAKTFYFHFAIETPSLPQSFSLFFFPKIAISLFISSFLFITKRNWWTIPILLFIDIWIVGNIIYYRASGFFINSDALQMIDNMQGFWDSILIYFSWGELIPFFTTMLYTIFVIKFSKKRSIRHIGMFFVFMILIVFMRFFVNYFHHSDIIKDYWVRNEKINVESIWKTIRPITDSQFEAYSAARRYFNHGFFTDWEKQYIAQNSILDFFFANISYYISKKYYTNKTRELKQHVELVQSDEKIISNLIRIDSLTPLSAPQTNLVVLLFESLEGWIFEDFEGSEHIAPNMKKLIGKDHILFAPRIKSQAKQGNSGDGHVDYMGITAIPITLIFLIPL